MPIEQQRVATSIRLHTPVSDDSFDRFMPAELREVSAMYWTPLIVAVRVATWLDDAHVQTVVDLGSGAGKLCVAAAIACKARFVGVEQRERLVRAARELATRFQVSDRATFVHGALGSVELGQPDAYYLYNSFGENLFPPAHQLDADVELSDARYLGDIALTEALFREAKVGTYVITYGGYGGAVPAGFVEHRADASLPNTLRMWQKRS